MDLTIEIRSFNRHIFQHVRDTHREWRSVLDAVWPLVVDGIPEPIRSRRWCLLFRGCDEEDSFVRALPEERIADGISKCRRGRLAGRMEVFVVFANQDGSFSAVPPPEAVEVVYSSSLHPLQLPKPLIDFIDHLRPASQVS